MSESMHPIPEQQWHKQPSVRSTLCRALSISAPIAKCTHHGVTCKVHYHREAIVIQHDHVCFLGLSQSRVSKAETAATGVASAIQLTPGEAVEKWTLALQLDHIVERSSTMQEMSHRLAGDGHHSQAHEHMSLTHHMRQQCIKRGNGSVGCNAWNNTDVLCHGSLSIVSVSS